jgi:methylthioribose-1-phosphate isomerase
MRTIEWNEAKQAVVLIDQRQLPEALTRMTLTRPEQVAEAIQDMAVRGAPAIGAAAAFGLALVRHSGTGTSSEALWNDLTAAADRLRRSRPTAVNLGWAVDRVLQAAQRHLAEGPQAVEVAVLAEAQRIADEDVEINRAMGRHGAELLHDGDTVVHHCNTGALATVDFGTALGVIQSAHEQGKRIHVLVDETRPRLQGTRLTAWELQRLGIPFEIITDGAAGFYLHRGDVAAVLVGADRVAANGDVANKIGTYMLALAAQDCLVPFYCAVPLSTIDMRLDSGSDIPIEERDPAEVLDLERDGRPIAPPGVRARNPAFDVTPARLVSAWITERGVLRPPFPRSLSAALEGTSPWASS